MSSHPDDWTRTPNMGRTTLAAIAKRKNGRLPWRGESVCSCPAHPFPHPAHRPPEGEDIWEALKAMIKEDHEDRKQIQRGENL